MGIENSLILVLFLLSFLIEFSPGESVICALVFILIYYGSMAALAWLCVFAYVWNLTCNSVGKILSYLHCTFECININVF